MTRRKIINIKAVSKLSAFHTKAIYIVAGMKTTVSFDIFVSTKLKGSDDLDKLWIYDIWKYIKLPWIEP